VKRPAIVSQTHSISSSINVLGSQRQVGRTVHCHAVFLTRHSGLPSAANNSQLQVWQTPRGKRWQVAVFSVFCDVGIVVEARQARPCNVENETPYHVARLETPLTIGSKIVACISPRSASTENDRCAFVLIRKKQKWSNFDVSKKAACSFSSRPSGSGFD